MSEVSLMRPKSGSSPVASTSRYLLDFSRKHTVLGLFILALMLGLFGMPVLYGAADSFMWSDEEQPMQNITPDQAHDEATKLHVEATAKSSPSATSVHGSTSVSATTNAANPQDSVDVTVNGQTVPVSQDGTVQKHFSSKDGKTVVDVRVDGGDSSTHSSTSIEINSQTFSSGSETNDAKGRHPARR